MSKYKVNYYPGCVKFKHVTCFWMCVLFYVSSVCLHVCAYAFKLKVHCGSTLEPGASKLPHYCTTPVSVPDVIGSKTTKQKNWPERRSISRVPSSRALPGFPITAPPPFFFPSVLCALAVLRQTQKKRPNV